jgi:hypothetical protein
VTQDDRFVSELELHNTGKVDREITVVQWTTTDPEGEPVSLEGDSFRIRRMLKDGNKAEVPADIHYNSPDSKGARCLQAYFAEGGSDRPDFEETPWFELDVLPTPRAKRPMEKPSPIIAGSRVYCGLFRPVPLKAGQKVAHRFEANLIFKGKGINFRARRPDTKDEVGWASFWEKVPKFHCDNKELERVVRHRFELLYLLRQPHGAGLSRRLGVRGQRPVPPAVELQHAGDHARGALAAGSDAGARLPEGVLREHPPQRPGAGSAVS